MKLGQQFVFRGKQKVDIYPEKVSSMSGTHTQSSHHKGCVVECAINGQRTMEPERKKRESLLPPPYPRTGFILPNKHYSSV